MIIIHIRMDPAADTPRSNMKGTLTICTMGTFTAPMLDMWMSTLWRREAPIRLPVLQAIRVERMTGNILTAQAADTKPFRTVAIPIIW